MSPTQRSGVVPPGGVVERVPTWRGGVKSPTWRSGVESHLEVWVIESLLVMIFTQRGGVVSPTQMKWCSKSHPDEVV